MEACIDQILDSPSKNSYIGSYRPPPDRILQISKQLDFSAHASSSRDTLITCVPVTENKTSIDSKAVVDALKTLQDKIRRLELERKEAEKSYRQFTRDIQKQQQQVKASDVVHRQGAAETEHCKKKELQCAEARCKSLEKQLDYMKRMVERAQMQRDALPRDNEQGSQQNGQQSSSNAQIQQEKLETLEAEYLKLSRTQTVAEMKLAMLEQRLLKEEEERKRVQEKADELQKELELNLHLAVPATEENEPKKKTKKSIKKAPKSKELLSPSAAMCRKMPFVAGKSISPSHSVHANVQSILHLMKHHQPHLCERVSALHRSGGGGAKKNLQREFSPRKSDDPCEQTAQSLSSLSDLLLALQDELGHLSFEHQDLVRAIDNTQSQEERQELQAELERLVARVEEKGLQITKLRKHQQAVKKLAQPRAEDHAAETTSRIEPPPAPSVVVKPKQKKKKGATANNCNNNNNLQLLRETQKFRSSLRQDNIFWES